MRLTSKAKVGIGFALALLISSCSEEPSDKSAFTDKQQDEVTDIVDDAVDDSIEGNEKILELEERINKIEQRLEI